jgi:hypothetical protein
MTSARMPVLDDARALRWLQHRAATIETRRNGCSGIGLSEHSAIEQVNPAYL